MSMKLPKDFHFIPFELINEADKYFKPREKYNLYSKNKILKTEFFEAKYNSIFLPNIITDMLFETEMGEFTDYTQYNLKYYTSYNQNPMLKNYWALRYLVE